jgi:alpha-D-ribose 1-methylphosphonate 5-triphosphate synthase subunit PhnG
MVKNWASGKMTPLQVLAERECIYQVLSQTTPENLNKNHSDYTIDPNTRYLICPKTVAYLYLKKI